MIMHVYIRMMVTDLVRERQEYGGYFPEGTYQLSMRLHTLHCLIKCDYYIHCRYSGGYSVWISCTTAYLSGYQHTGHDLLCIPTEREVDKWWWCKKEQCEPTVSARRWEGQCGATL